MMRSLFLLMFLVVEVSQQPATGTIEGVVRLQGTSRPLQNVKVSAAPQNGGSSQLQTTTDSSGHFVFRDISPANYSVTAIPSEEYARPTQGSSTRDVTVKSNESVRDMLLTLDKTGV